MTSDILKRAAEAVEGTTPGPWVHKPIKGYAIDQIGHEEFCVCDVSYTSANIAEVGEYCETAKNRAKRPGEIEANARFIGAARTLIPDMAAAIAERDAEIERLTARAEAAGAMADRLVMDKDSDCVLGEPAYRVDATSNYNHESYAESTKLGWLTESQAERIAAILNESGGGGPTFYQARKHGIKLWRGMEEFV